MQDSNAPTKIPLVWAASAGAGYINTIPTLSQIGIANGRASFTDGFPPLNFTPVAAGGVPPFGGDFNGIIQQLSAGVQWNQAGGPNTYDSVFQAAIGGYPMSAVVYSATTFGLFWISTIDNNLSNPDAGGANWVPLFYIPATVNPNFYINASTGNDTTGNGTAALPWATLQKARNVAATYNYGGKFAPIYNCTGAFTAGVRCAGPLIGQSGAEQFVFSSGSSVTATNTDCFTISGGAIVSVSGSGTPVALSTTGSVAGAGYAIQCLGSSNCFIGAGVNFGACYASHVGASLGSVVLNNNYTISGGATAHLSIFLGGGVINTNLNNPQTVTITGNPNFTGAFAVINTPGQISSLGVTWSGPATGQRYNASFNGIIQTNGSGATYFPGNSSGSTSTGGQYG